jgi:hypothetical protein
MAWIHRETFGQGLYKGEVDADPSANATPAPVGSVCTFGITEWKKIGAGATDWIRTDARFTTVTNLTNGFEDRAASTQTWSDSGPNRTLGLSPAAASYNVWVAGVQVEISGAQTVQISNDEGKHFVYVDSDGVVKTTTTFTDDLILEKALAHIVYWDATNSRGRVYEERHGILMAGQTHLTLHNTVGARWSSGLSLGDILADQSGALDTHAQCSIAGGTYYDEDVDHTIASRAAPAQTRMYYREGATGAWRWDALTDFPLKIDAVSGRAAWNEWTGAAWQQTAVTSNRYCLTHIYATNDVDDGIAVVQGQNTYITLASAQVGAEEELPALNLFGLPSPEWVAIGTLIWQTRDSYGNAVKSRIRSTATGADYLDWRASSPAPGEATGPTVNTDGQIHITAGDIPDDAVIATATGANGNVVKRRAGSAATTSTRIPLSLPARSTASRGRQITSYDFVYSVNTADVDDVQLRLYTTATPADNSAMAAPSLVAVTYDTAHDSAAKRKDSTGAPEYHTATMTVTTPAYIGDGEGLYLDWWTDGDAGAAGVVDVYEVVVYYTETLVP